MSNQFFSNYKMGFIKYLKLLYGKELKNAFFPWQTGICPLQCCKEQICEWLCNINSKELQDSLQVMPWLYLIKRIFRVKVSFWLSLVNLVSREKESNLSFINGIWGYRKTITQDPRWRRNLLNSNLSYKQWTGEHYQTMKQSCLMLKQVKQLAGYLVDYNWQTAYNKTRTRTQDEADFGREQTEEWERNWTSSIWFKTLCSY